MLPLSVSALASPPTSTAETPLGQPGDAAGASDFGDLLTAQIAAPGGAPALPVSLNPLTAALPALQTAAASLPEGGKILPGALPDAAPVPGTVPGPVAMPASEPVAMPDPAGTAAQLLTAVHSDPEPAVAPDKPMPLAAPLRLPIAARVKDEAAQETAPAATDRADADEGDTMPIAAANPAPATLQAVPLNPAPAVETSAAKSVEQTPADQSPPAARPATRLPPQAQLAQAEPVRAPAMPAAPAQPQALPVLALDRAAPQAAAVLAPALPGNAPAPALSARVRLNETPPSQISELPLDTAQADGAALAIPLASPAAPVAAPDTAPTAPLANRPHDFAALVDSLVAAREAAQPQTVAVALSHAEFGQVHLRFNHDDAGLSVSMASADPDFARAVNLAAPVAQSGMTSGDGGSQQPANPGQAQAQNAARQTGGNAASGGFSQGQERPTPERGEQREPRANPAAAASAADRTRQTRTGIFA